MFSPRPWNNKRSQLKPVSDNSDSSFDEDMFEAHNNDRNNYKVRMAEYLFADSSSDENTSNERSIEIERRTATLSAAKVSPTVTEFSFLKEKMAVNTDDPLQSTLNRSSLDKTAKPISLSPIRTTPLVDFPQYKVPTNTPVTTSEKKKKSTKTKTVDLGLNVHRVTRAKKKFRLQPNTPSMLKGDESKVSGSAVKSISKAKFNNKSPDGVKTRSKASKTNNREDVVRAVNVPSINTEQVNNQQPSGRELASNEIVQDNMLLSMPPATRQVMSTPNEKSLSPQNNPIECEIQISPIRDLNPLFGEVFPNDQSTVNSAEIVPEEFTDDDIDDIELLLMRAKQVEKKFLLSPNTPSLFEGSYFERTQYRWLSQKYGKRKQSLTDEKEVLITSLSEEID